MNIKQNFLEWFEFKYARTYCKLEKDKEIFSAYEAGAFAMLQKLMPYVTMPLNLAQDLKSEETI